MPVAERTFAVPCPCSAVLDVTSGQAGTRVACPTCGAAVDVPRLRDLLIRAAPAAASGSSRPAWDAARGATFAAATVALLAALAAAAAPPFGSLFVPHPPEADEVRRAVAAAPISAIHSAWTEMSQAGLIRTPSPQEVRFARFTRVTRGLSRVLWGVAVVAGGIAAAAVASRTSHGRGGVGP